MAKWNMSDGRPMSTDEFLRLLRASPYNDADKWSSILDWLDGDWEAALEGLR